MGRVIENWDLYVLPRNYPQFTWTRVRFNIHTVVEDTHIFTAAVVNSFRVGFYKEKVTDGDPLYGVTPFKGDQAVKDLGLQGVNPKGLSAQGFPTMSIMGYPALQTQPGGLVQNDHDWGYADTLTWSRGKHVLKFGGELKPQSRFVGNVPEGSYGSFTFNGSLSGYGYSDFLLGLPYQSTRLDPLTNRTLLDNELGVFVTDSWKAYAAVYGEAVAYFTCPAKVPSGLPNSTLTVYSLMFTTAKSSEASELKLLTAIDFGLCPTEIVWGAWKPLEVMWAAVTSS